MVSSLRLPCPQQRDCGGGVDRESRILGFNVGKRVLEFLLVFLTFRNASVRVGDKKCFAQTFWRQKSSSELFSAQVVGALRAVQRRLRSGFTCHVEAPAAVEEGP